MKTNKLGYVAAMDSSNSEVTGGIDAFALGIYSVNPDAEVYVKVTNGWFDPAGEEAAARQLVAMGCDVLAQHCDTSYPQTVADENGVYGIGYNSDMSKEAPNACLCSVIWNWSAYYTSAVQSIIDGTWDGSNYYGGMTENLLGITELADFCAEGTQEKVAERTGGAMQKSSEKAVDTLANLRNINDEVEHFIEEIRMQTNRTNDSVQQIYQATSIITSIAEETNLLSLNAAIEAARAGESGRCL